MEGKTTRAQLCAKEVCCIGIDDYSPKPVVLSGVLLLLLKYCMTLGNGYLGSCIDEERSEMRYVV